MDLYCGIDWATAHHDVAVVDADGRVVARGRVGNDAAAFAQVVDVVGRGRRQPRAPDPGGHRNRSRVVGGCPARDRPADLSDQPVPASRDRSRYAVSGAKSDGADAVLLANVLAYRCPAHRPLPADTELAQAIRVLARAQQDAVSPRQQIGNQIRDLLKDFYPAALIAFAERPSGGLARADARTILAAAPTPRRPPS
jgi:hypothetical protein